MKFMMYFMLLNLKLMAQKKEEKPVKKAAPKKEEKPAKKACGGCKKK